jgi:hypothetical protein
MVTIQVSVEFGRLRIGLTNAVGRRLALRFIGTLLLLPAAFALPSGNGVSSLSGEIALLYASLSPNHKLQKHHSVVEDVVARVEDITIWATIIDLIARTRSIPYPTTLQSSAFFVASLQQTP